MVRAADQVGAAAGREDDVCGGAGGPDAGAVLRTDGDLAAVRVAVRIGVIAVAVPRRQGDRTHEVTVGNVRAGGPLGGADVHLVRKRDLREQPGAGSVAA
jgi:hypothetical protein